MTDVKGNPNQNLPGIPRSEIENVKLEFKLVLQDANRNYFGSQGSSVSFDPKPLLEDPSVVYAAYASDSEHPVITQVISRND